MLCQDADEWRKYDASPEAHTEDDEIQNPSVKNKEQSPMVRAIRPFLVDKLNDTGAYLRWIFQLCYPSLNPSDFEEEVEVFLHLNPEYILIGTEWHDKAQQSKDCVCRLELERDEHGLFTTQFKVVAMSDVSEEERNLYIHELIKEPESEWSVNRISRVFHIPLLDLLKILK